MAGATKSPSLISIQPRGSPSNLASSEIHQKPHDENRGTFGAISQEYQGALNSHPMTRNVSASSSNSANHQENGDPSPYGTRSRKTGIRPNYADDAELDSGILGVKNDDVGNSTLSAATDPTAKSGGEPAQPRAHTTIKLNMKPNLTPNGMSSGFTAANSIKSVSSPAPGSQPPEKKKRKYERHQPPKKVTNGFSSTSGKDRVPGISTFAASQSPNADPPPAKRRKTGDGLSHVEPSPSRKTSVTLAPKHALRETCVVTFDKSGGVLKNGKLEADDGSTYSVNDHVYLICEPPGDPYYLCRIMEFRNADPADPSSPVVSMLVNWFYRPRDIGRLSNDLRFLFASMQSDESPITSLRGKCHIKHRTEIKDLEEFRKQRDAFWFTQLYDRYSQRPYEIIPSSTVINVPEKVKKVLDERWRFIVVEQTRQKELTSAVKLCKRCSLYCASNDSVDCGVCRDTYHMACVRPPLAKKPSRGFAWSCGPCSRAQERKLKQRHTTLVAESSKDREDDNAEDEEEEAGAITAVSDPIEYPAGTADDIPPEQADTAHANIWPWRYLGIHCRVEDVLQYDDRAIYPRASSRLGPKHQANVVTWPGQPIEYVKPTDIRKKYMKGTTNKKDPKNSKEATAAMEQEKTERANRPKWVQDQPPGYVARGEDHDPDDPECTATPLFVKPSETRTGFSAANAPKKSIDDTIDKYMDKARESAEKWSLTIISKRGDPHISTNYLDQALKLLSEHRFSAPKALEALEDAHNPVSLCNPEFNKEELKRFEDGVAKYGSDLRSVRRYVKTKSYGDIVRFYYTWKFSQRGEEIWGHHQGRRGAKRRAETSWTDIADDEDDSAFDNDKAVIRKRRFQCKHCHTRISRQWRRAPHVAPGATVLVDPKSSGKDKSNQLVVALCQRCAVLWRRYAMLWFDPEEFARPINQSGGRAWKRKNDEELLRELVSANEVARVPTSGSVAQAAAAIGVQVTIHMDLPKKKPKASSEKETTPIVAPVEPQKRAPPPVPPPRPPTPPIEPVQPKWRQLPCAVCRYLESAEDELLNCKECKLAVHRRCYAVPDQTPSTKWVCDPCVNDKNSQHSLRYECALCPVANRVVELVEPPKVSHKKKTDRDREKERLEKELAQKKEDDYLRSQRQKGRPLYPREALKLTASNNWMHITCAIWTPEVKFSDSAKMQAAEGMGAVVASSARMESVCKLCQRPEGACVSCQQCHAPFHIGCAHEAGYTFGFDVSPVKGSRKDMIHSVTLGTETGSLSAAIWCKEHAIKTIVHDMTEIVEPESKMNALQLYCQVYKQADLTFTGTARKANLLAQPAKLSAQTMSAGNRHSSVTINGSAASSHPRALKASTPTADGEQSLVNGAGPQSDEGRYCVSCSTNTSLRWYEYHSKEDDTNQTNGTLRLPYEYRTWQCHKCHMKEQLEAHNSDDPNRSKISSSQAHPFQPDFFELTAPNQLTEWAPNGQALPSIGVPEFFEKEAKYLTITLNNPKYGGLHVFHGRDFGVKLDADPTPAFRFVVYYAQQDCKYYADRDVILMEDGSWITFPKSFMQALIKVIFSNRREAHWRVVNAREVPCIPMKAPVNIPNMDMLRPGTLMRTPGFNEPPPVPPAQLQQPPPPPLGPPSYGYPRRRPSNPRPLPRAALAPPLPDSRIAGPPSLPAAPQPATPYLSQQSPARAPSYGSSGVGPSEGPGVARPTTPHESSTGAMSGVGGASSSPNLRNLMH